MAPHDQAFEAQIVKYRKNRRLLVATNVNHNASSQEFKKFCNKKLSRPNTVKFFWPTGSFAGKKHGATAMLAFEERDHLQKALNDLGEKFQWRGREVKIGKARRHAVSETE